MMKPSRRCDSLRGDTNKHLAGMDRSSDVAAGADSAKAAEYIGATLRGLSRPARAAGLIRLTFLLEAAALEAGRSLKVGNTKAVSSPDKPAPV